MRLVRRAALSAGVTLLLVLGLGPYSNAGEIEAEGTVYGGSTTGGWACGPTMRASYAGAAAGVRYRDQKPDAKQGEGTTVRGAAALEYETNEVVDEGCTEPCEVEPVPDALHPGVHARIGYHWHYFGLEPGLIVFTGWDKADDTKPTLVVLPTLELSGGPRDSIYGVIGAGAPTLTMLRRYAAYVGGGVALRSGVWLNSYLSAARSGPSLDSAGPRFDLLISADLTNSVALKLGGSVNSGDNDYVGGEGALGFAARF